MARVQHEYIAILKYFKRKLPSADDTKIGETATKEANQQVQAALDRAIRPGSTGRRKRMAYAV